MELNRIDIHRVVLIIGVSMIPILLGSQIYNVVDCTKLAQNGYKLWLKDNPGKTFNQFVDSCNAIHPLALYLMVPFALPMGLVVWHTTRKGVFDDKPKKESKT